MISGLMMLAMIFIHNASHEKNKEIYTKQIGEMGHPAEEGLPQGHREQSDSGNGHAEGDQNKTVPASCGAETAQTSG